MKSCAVWIDYIHRYKWDIRETAMREDREMRAPSKRDLSSPGLSICGDQNGGSLACARSRKSTFINHVTENLEIPPSERAKRFHVSQFPMAVGRACTTCRGCSQFVGIFSSALCAPPRLAPSRMPLIVDLTQDIYFLRPSCRLPWLFFLQKSQRRISRTRPAIYIHI